MGRGVIEEWITNVPKITSCVFSRETMYERVCLCNKYKENI